jgi:hypothetical protein
MIVGCMFNRQRVLARPRTCFMRLWGLGVGKMIGTRFSIVSLFGGIGPRVDFMQHAYKLQPLGLCLMSIVVAPEPMRLGIILTGDTFPPWLWLPWKGGGWSITRLFSGAQGFCVWRELDEAVPRSL